MKCNFLMDENMVVRALVMPRASELWRLVSRNGHTVTVSSELYGKYSEKLKTARRHKKLTDDAVAEATIGIIRSVLSDSNRCLWVEPAVVPSPLAALVGHLKDRFLADIAYEVITKQIATDCVFVSVDKRTRDNFNHAQMRALNISGVTIEEAIKLAR